MLRIFDRVCVALLALFSAGHGIVGTLMSSPLDQQITLWSFSGSIAAWLIAALNWMRGSRQGDQVLAFWALVGALSWIGLMIWLMPIADMWADIRPWLFIAVCAVLAFNSLRELTASSPNRPSERL
ncbi:hypothetical protein U91I_03690 [alpha proteobacterium U9-1i]|nr:hypothetical protein U91I_03690 [alpha proteobacterium U9-1i]